MDLIKVLSYLGLIIILFGVITIVMYLQVRTSNKMKLRKKNLQNQSAETTYFLDEGEDNKKCEICYGEINEEDVAVCKCGKIFHRACAEPTKTCPYCGIAFDQMEVRQPERTRCPVCGRYVKGNICECGAVIPRKDNTFLCSCGNRVDVNKPVCKKCGAVYEIVTMQTVRRKK